MTTEFTIAKAEVGTSPSKADVINETRLESLFAHIRDEVARGKGRPFQILMDAKFTEEGRLVGEACFDLKHRFNTQNG